MGKNMKNSSRPEKNHYKDFKMENPKIQNGYGKMHKLDNNEYVSRSHHHLKSFFSLCEHEKSIKSNQIQCIKKTFKSHKPISTKK